MNDDAQNTSRLRALIDGYQISQSIAVMAELGIADALEVGGRTAIDLAQELGTDSHATARLLHALATVDLVSHDGHGVFSLTKTGELLRSHHPHSQRHVAIHAGQPYMWMAWSHLQHSIRTGTSAFRHVHGTSAWEYRSLHASAGAVFANAMVGGDDVADAILEAFDFAPASIVADLGGGHGVLLSAILKQNPTTHGILFELPGICTQATAFLGDQGVADRCSVVAGDLLDDMPVQADIYILKGVIHDWGDDDALRILRNCRRGMKAGSKLLLIDHVMDDQAGCFERFLDLHMLVTHGGVERTHEAFVELLESAGLDVLNTVPTRKGVSIIEATPAT